VTTPFLGILTDYTPSRAQLSRYTRFSHPVIYFWQRPPLRRGLYHCSLNLRLSVQCHHGGDSRDGAHAAVKAQHGPDNYEPYGMGRSGRHERRVRRDRGEARAREGLALEGRQAHVDLGPDIHPQLRAFSAVLRHES
jgi:hypothetical protein